MRLLIILVLALLVAGCSNNPSVELKAEESRQARLDALAAACDTDLCVVMVAQESSKNMPKKSYHPAWGIVDRAIGMAIPSYFGYKQTEALTGAMVGITRTVGGMDRAYTDNSINVGRDQIGGDRVNDHSISVGGDLTGGDRINDSSAYVGRDTVGGDQWHGSEYADTCVGDECSSQSPIDNSDNSDRSDNSDSSDNSTYPAAF